MNFNTAALKQEKRFMCGFFSWAFRFDVLIFIFIENREN